MNNAAIGYGDALKTLFNRLNAGFHTNTAGVYATVETFELLLRKSSMPRIINVTSGVGSFSRRLDARTPSYDAKGPQYRVSKAAIKRELPDGWWTTTNMAEMSFCTVRESVRVA